MSAMTTTTHVIHRAVLYAQRTAVIQATIDVARMPRWLPAAYRAVDEFLAARGLTPCGPPFARFTRGAGKITVEAGYAVPGVITGDGYVMASTLPHGPVAIAVHHGLHESVEDTHLALQDWLALHNYVQEGQPWEVCLTDPITHADPDAWRTEVVVPYRAA
jgi:effector-binding domain-containing protein